MNKWRDRGKRGEKKTKEIISPILFRISKYRQNCFEFRNDINCTYLFQILIHYSIFIQIFMTFDTFEIFDTICMCLPWRADKPTFHS